MLVGVAKAGGVKVLATAAGSTGFVQQNVGIATGDFIDRARRTVCHGILLSVKGKHLSGVPPNSLFCMVVDRESQRVYAYYQPGRWCGTKKSP